ncbi:phosphoethanolamine--lipid A transferase [Zobellella aerophila]|uniref:Phosphoethanolamine--lipid A transferase n=1 Tax=Zobellella aerophila TaxID=870480 RepID=A0ABP6V3T0_9GAMM
MLFDRRMCISSLGFVFLLSLYFFFVLNIPLIAKLVDILDHLERVKLGFIISIPFFFVACLNIIFTLLAIKYIEKGLFIILVLLSSSVSYAMYNYGVIFDREMIVNILQTHSGEAKSYLNFSSFLWFLLTGVIPAVVIFRTDIIHGGLLKGLLWKVFSILASLLVIAVIALFYYKDYASVGRNESYIKKLIIPTYYVSSAGGYFYDAYLKEALPYQTLGEDAVSAAPSENGKHTLLVLMIGETARSMNFAYNGYPRDTNSFTKELGFISFRDVSSCGTATAVSVPCMFSHLSKADFSPEQADHQDNLLDVLSHAGIDIRWYENDGGCKGVCRNIATVEFRPEDGGPLCDGDYCKDGVLLGALEQAIEKTKDKDTVLVLHMVGSHGPTYYQRYPDEFAHFKPDCARSDIQNCNARELMNTYDNTIYYDDYIIGEVVKALNNRHDHWNTGLVYISDHGESLGESGLYLHGMPYAMAPEQQTRVPMLVWLSSALAEEKKLDNACLKHKAETGRYSHDNLFDSVLGLLDISTGLYRQELDIFSPCRHS